MCLMQGRLEAYNTEISRYEVPGLPSNTFPQVSLVLSRGSFNRVLTFFRAVYCHV